jgi:DNA-binding CsgD family transcriptional regulator
LALVDQVAWCSPRGAGTAWGSWASPAAPNLRGDWEAITVACRGGWERTPPPSCEGWRDGVGGWPALCSTVWQLTPARREGHPAPFPLELARRCVRDARALLATAPAPGDHLLQKARRLDGALQGSPRAEAPTGAGDLTGRELAVLRMLPGTASAREIADQLYVSHNTVKTQLKSIYRKLGVATRAEAVAAARERGLVLLSCGLYGNVIRILVPIVIGDEDLARGLELLEESLVAASTSA